jgi:hypothetical protein
MAIAYELSDDRRVVLIGTTGQDPLDAEADRIDLLESGRSIELIALVEEPFQGVSIYPSRAAFYAAYPEAEGCSQQTEEKNDDN